ncbi:sensor histidine kinase [Dasania marina]|uniref:sensor histidine kinase n=1 Tax=Dasania marina TaxID=471499 RepID=UPI00036F6BD0|nr:ATP-binding protein [Dasania marina]
MNIDLWQLSLFGIAYLLLLFAIASMAERGLIPEKVIRHPLVYVLSLGVFASAFAIYGVIGLAHEYGYGFLSYYFGIAGAFIFAPLMLLPLLRICRSQMHSSLADVLTFRYHSQWAGSVMTIFMLLAVMPLLAMQIQAVSDSLHILSTDSTQLFSNETRHNNVALVFCLIISAFTISFGSSHITTHERHNGLVAAIAFESLIKLLGLLTAGGVALFYVFDGPADLDQWLLNNPQTFALLNTPMREDSARSMLLIFFSAVVAMPHLFHMIFAENPNIKAVRTAIWGMPLLMLLMSIPVLPILWAGFKLDSVLPSDYFPLGIGIELKQTWLAMAVFIAGLSAASGAIIVTTLALASMCLKHLVLPFYKPSHKKDIYRWLLLIRRSLMVAIILAGYAFFRLIVGYESLSGLSLASLIAGLQFLPGILAALYWQKANRNGFLAGLTAGFIVWFFTLLLPIVSEFNPEFIRHFYFNYSYGDLWNASTIVSLLCNIVTFITVSLATYTRPEEIAAAEFCSSDDLNRPTRQRLRTKNPQEMKDKLAAALGLHTASREVDRALEELDITIYETRPLALRRLRFRLEANLSSLLGPAVAHDMIIQLLATNEHEFGERDDLNLIEDQLEGHKHNLTGLAADLDSLRRYHRQTLQDLPVGVCSISQDHEILMWNDSIASITTIDTQAVTGSLLHKLPAPWGALLHRFIQQPELHLYKQYVEINGAATWVNLHKSSAQANPEQDGQVIVLEDATDLQLLEHELTHSERLASIGRLAAGVAHEIGNPVTGIACLAQNLRYDTDNPDSLATAQEILQQTDRISKIVQTLVNFAHAGNNPQHQNEAVDIHNCAAEAIHLLALNTEAKPIDFQNHCPEQLYALGDAQRLQQIMVNLLSNARDASPANSSVLVSAEQQQGRVLISVSDQGSGISSEQQEQIFDPFFTTKEAGAGTGLGLSLVYSIVEDLDGSISVESPVPPNLKGTRFIVNLPATLAQIG